MKGKAFTPRVKALAMLVTLNGVEVKQITSTVSETLISALLESLDRDQQHDAIAKLMHLSFALKDRK